MEDDWCTAEMDGNKTVTTFASITKTQCQWVVVAPLLHLPLIECRHWSRGRPRNGNVLHCATACGTGYLPMAPMASRRGNERSNEQYFAVVTNYRMETIHLSISLSSSLLRQRRSPWFRKGFVLLIVVICRRGSSNHSMTTTMESTQVRPLYIPSFHPSIPSI